MRGLTISIAMKSINNDENEILILENDPLVSSNIKLVLQTIEELGEIRIEKNVDACKLRVEEPVFITPKLTLINVNSLDLDDWKFLDWYEQNGLQGTTRFVLFARDITPNQVLKSKKYSDVIAFYKLPLTHFKIQRILTRM